MFGVVKAALPAFFLFATSLALSDRPNASPLRELAKHGDPYWMETIKRQGSAPYSPEPDDYQVRHFVSFVLTFI